MSVLKLEESRTIDFIFILSDFYTQESFSRQLQVARSKHDLVALQVYDQCAKRLPHVGLMKVRDAETGHEMIIDTSSKAIQKAHTQYWTDRQDALQEVFAKNKVDWTSIATNEDYVKALLILFKKRG